MNDVVVITGASSGIGALTARALAKAGDIVYASILDITSSNAKQVQEAEQFAVDNAADLRSVEMDVTSQESVDAAMRYILAETGRLAVIVRNAGPMVFGAAEAFTPEQMA